MIQTIRIIIGSGLAAVAIFFAVSMYTRYRVATGTTFQRLLIAERDSATWLWGKFCMILAGLVGNLDSIADACGQPQIREYIDLALGNPKVVGGVLFAVSLGAMLARKRTMPVDKLDPAA